ncbi:MAG: DUF58 domain-containing protein [Pseudomonadota bacterium]
MAESATMEKLGGRLGRWLDRRIPPGPTVSLTQRNVFIFPTATGFALMGLMVLLVVVAINYQASLIYGVAFLLGSLFTVTILYTFRNLSGLRLERIGTRAGFVGEDVEVSLRASRPRGDGRRGRGREGIRIGFPGDVMHWVELYDQEADVVRVYARGSRRGYLRPGRLLVETRYPLGLLRAWTWVDLDIRALVYPRPLFEPLPDAAVGRRDEGELIDPHGSEDFTDIKAYRPGDPVKHIMWRSYARGDELVVKCYESFLEPRLWLDLDAVAGDLETRLSRLTGQALRATRLGREFGVRLGGREIKPGTGEVHLEGVLRELALYGLG